MQQSVDKNMLICCGDLSTQVALVVKNPPAGHLRDSGLRLSGAQKIWKRAWQPTLPWTEELGGLWSIGSQSQT